MARQVLEFGFRIVEMKEVLIHSMADCKYRNLEYRFFSIYILLQSICKILTFVDISSKRAQFIRYHPPSPCGLPTSLKLRQDKSEGRLVTPPSPFGLRRAGWSLVTPLRPSGYRGQAGHSILVTGYSSLTIGHWSLAKRYSILNDILTGP